VIGGNRRLANEELMERLSHLRTGQTFTPEGMAAKAALTRQFLARKREEYDALRLEVERLEWECEGVVREGFVLVIDYATTLSDLVDRPWLRTYRVHARGSGPLDVPGEQDITADVVLEQLDAASPFSRLRSDRQADWLDALGVGGLVEEGRRAWQAGAAEGGLDALAGRSRASEAAALTDPAGLGAHRVVLFGAGGAGRDFTW
jgi:SAM-dependent MidA family methyltransferase